MRNKNKVFIGIDTSCYTTSVAAVDECGNIISDSRRILSVPKGENGLRQSDGLFQHVRQLPDLYRQLLFDCRSKYGNEPFEIKEVAVSSKPRSNQDSYMPVFLAGKAFAHVIADSFGCCCFETDHQWGHLMAAMHQKKFNPDRTLYALHLSGGTTEMLKVDRQMHSADICGATIDSSTGQLVDRIGVMLGTGFPAGKELERMATEFMSKNPNENIHEIPVYSKNGSVSFSGPFSALKREYESSNDPGLVSAQVYSVIARTVLKWIQHRSEEDPDSQFLLMGGVSSSLLLKKMIQDRMNKKRLSLALHYADPVYSSDNAFGIALIALEEWIRNESSNN